MHFSKFFYLSIGMVTAITIPDGQPDGVYRVTMDAAGKELHTLIELASDIKPSLLAARDFPANTVNGGSLLRTRQSDNYNCGSNGLDRRSTDDAVEALKRQCDPGAVSAGAAFYSKVGTTVAYFCNFGNSAVVCQRNEIGGSYDSITRVCGSYREGWRTYQNTEKWYSIGYQVNGSGFCGRFS